ncbi:folate-binding protein [uncultured Litoreibacter sp.]|uniref:CAF17-like 4Fe-4S cluster assembly/insertion protein YgfZ n=1 Tax=uncultured Litoreibacter sp. TaxID=1392394 RepID=UPI00262DAEF5|nr:folate-binding protein [uncultured Litoreibacter sp.]
MTGELIEHRQILTVTGEDRIPFLQGLVTNDVDKLSDGLVYAALLSPQGKYLADFFLAPQPEAILIDVADTLAPALLKRLTMYRLRAKVDVTPADIAVTGGTGPAPDGGFADPRHPALGWRAYGPSGDTPQTDWASLYVTHQIPASGAELIPDASYILEMGFERLNGVDFKKGCYVGQEVTARMKHKTELRKGLAKVTLDGSAAQGTEITADGKPVGTLHTVAGNQALAYLRFDRAKGTMQAGAATLTLTPPTG